MNKLLLIQFFDNSIQWPDLHADAIVVVLFTNCTTIVLKSACCRTESTVSYCTKRLPKGLPQYNKCLLGPVMVWGPTPVSGLRSANCLSSVSSANCLSDAWGAASTYNLNSLGCFTCVNSLRSATCFYCDAWGADSTYTSNGLGCYTCVSGLRRANCFSDGWGAASTYMSNGVGCYTCVSGLGVFHLCARYICP